MFDTISRGQGIAVIPGAAVIRPFPYRHSPDCKFFVVRDGLILHEDSRGNIFWHDSTQYASEYNCEESGFFETEEAAKEALRTILLREALQRACQQPTVCEPQSIAAMVAP